MTGPTPQPSDAFTIRDCGPADLDAVMEIMGTAFEPTYGEAWSRSQCIGIMPMSGVCLRLAQRGEGDVVGFALIRTVADEAELLLIAVAPAARKSGIGTALVQDFIAIATDIGARRLHLEVRDGNTAMLLYQKAGFGLVGRRRDYYRGLDGHKRDALTLALDL